MPKELQGDLVSHKKEPVILTPKRTDWVKPGILPVDLEEKNLTMRREKPWIPEHDLWAAVLFTALKDFVDGDTKIECWFLDRTDRRNLPGGFIWICEHLDLDAIIPGIIRAVTYRDRTGGIARLCLNKSIWRKFRSTEGMQKGRKD